MSYVKFIQGIYMILIEIVSQLNRGLGINATLGSIYVVNSHETLSYSSLSIPRPLGPFSIHLYLHPSFIQTTRACVYLLVYDDDSNLGVKKYI